MTTLAAFPVHDWQFWVATAIFLFAAAWLLRGVLPVPWLSRRHEQKKSRRAVRLTIEGKSLSQRRGGAEAAEKFSEGGATDQRG
jgi:hypothetical protein